MKLLIVTSSYTTYLQAFYGSRPDLRASCYNEQKAAYEADAFGWSSCWRDALLPYGWEVSDIVWNVEPMQRAWARERGIKEWGELDLKQIALLQAKEFQPDLVWFDDHDPAFLKALRQEISAIRAALGWVGSAMPKTPVWRDLDLVLSCAPESVQTLKDAGYPALVFPHSFDPAILRRLEQRQKSAHISFVGQLLRFNDFHLRRDEILDLLARQVPLAIHSPSSSVSGVEELRSLVKVAVNLGMTGLTHLGISENTLRRLPLLGVVAGLTPGQCRPVNPRLRPFLKPPVFGLEMFQLLADSLLALNIHADSSPEFASNMRLYEVTGVGSCLVSDWKSNLHEIFEPDSEVAVFQSAEECVEKVKWLLEHKSAAEEMGRAGQRRTLENYTFAHRAPKLAEILERLVRIQAPSSGKGA
ncbi:radical SAM protein [Geoanaerobacter pelophilus]|uniref:Radical SAM protein n=1 Tax=Geoanaerobacter pelophilus TaxID=60036 RepID=A0ABQ0MHU0_9BACT|nr:glycosyltransferase [Geoanaerobacter pelophilus]GAW66652.1 radical SAM protein [Geoanaerobacter pelophilus]